MIKKRDTLVYIEDILDSFDKILRYTENLTEKEFEVHDENKMLSFAASKSLVKPSKAFPMTSGYNIHEYRGEQWQA